MIGDDRDSVFDADDQLTIGDKTAYDSLYDRSSLHHSHNINNSNNKAALKQQLAMDQQIYPDELDTPDDVSARTRFARYRALQSFRASHWHPKENLPGDYCGLFQFENFAGTQKRCVVCCM